MHDLREPRLPKISSTRLGRGMRRAAGVALRVVLCTGLLLLSPGGPQLVAAQERAVAQQRAQDGLDAFAERLETIRSDLDATRFDVSELGLDLAFEDAETITDEIRARIAYEPYVGLLRGAEGTLVSEAGNALDQSMLLAVLLGDAGYDVRIARATLPREQAEALLRQMSARERPQARTPDAALLADLGLEDEELAEVGERADERSERVLQDVDEAATVVLDELVSADLPLQDGDMEGLIEEARDYFWVEHRFGSGEPWQAAHVAFDAPPEALAGLEPESHLEGSVPAELQHRFRVQVFVEQRLGDDLEVHSVMSPWERPAANLVGRPLTYTNMPDGLEDTDGPTADVDDLVEDSSLFMPFFNDALAGGAQFFDLDGNAVPAEAGASPAAGVFQSLGGSLGGAAGSLAGEEDPSEFVALTAQWIEYTMIAPGGEETTHRRYVVDRLGTENREAGTLELDAGVDEAAAGRALLSTHTFMLAPGRYAPDYVTDRSLSGALAAQSGLSEAFAGVQDPSVDPKLPEADLAEATRPLMHLNLFGAFDGRPAPEGTLRYRPAPALVVIDAGWDGSYARVDIVSEPRRALTLEAGELPAWAPREALLDGIWQTRVEGMPLDQEWTRTQNTFRTVAAAQEADVALRTLAPGAAEDEIAELELPAASEAAISEDLERGYAVITPERLPDEALQAGWWRVDPRTGETLGRGGDGRGQELAEYLQTLEVEAALLRGGLILAGTRGLGACLTSGSGAQFACCVFENTLVAGASVGLGAVLGGLFAVPALALFLVLDLGVGTAMMIGGLAGALPSMCSGLAGRCLFPIPMRT